MKIKLLACLVALIIVLITILTNITQIKANPTKYLVVAKTVADKYINAGVHQPTGLFFSTVFINGTSIDTQNFAEEERLYESLILLSELTNDTRYTNLAGQAVDGFLEYVPHPNTGLPPQGDSNNYMPIAQQRTSKCTFTENLIDVIPLWEVASNKTAVIQLVDAYYKYMTSYGGTPGRVTDIVYIDTGKSAGFHNVAMNSGILTVLLVEAWRVTGNDKYLRRAEEIWQWWETNNQGKTGLLYGTTNKSATPYTHWFTQNYDWSFARALGYCLKYTDSPIILRIAKEHMDALISYGWNLDGKYHWAGRIDADTGWADPNYYKMPPFAEYYQDIGFIELYKKTGNKTYLDVVSLNALSSSGSGSFNFPTHNVPAAIETNLDLYEATGNTTYLEKAKAIGDKLTDWIIAKNYSVYGGLGGESTETMQVDNVFHSVLALLRLDKDLGGISTTTSTTTLPPYQPEGMLNVVTYLGFEDVPAIVTVGSEVYTAPLLNTTLNIGNYSLTAEYETQKQILTATIYENQTTTIIIKFAEITYG